MFDFSQMPKISGNEEMERFLLEKKKREAEEIERALNERERNLMPFKKRALKELYQLGDEKNVDVSDMDLSTPYDFIMVKIHELCREDGYHFLKYPRFLEILERVRGTDKDEVKEAVSKFDEIEKNGLDW